MNDFDDLPSRKTQNTGGSGETVVFDADQIRSIANKYVAAAWDKVNDGLATFKGTPAGAAGFGGSEAGAELAGLHAAVKTVFTDAVDGVKVDLHAYKGNLIQGANAWEQADTASAERSRGLVDRLTAAAPVNTQGSFDRARETAGQALSLSDDLVAQADNDRLPADAPVPQADPFAGKPLGPGGQRPGLI